jgi:hypothetical protein
MNLFFGRKESVSFKRVLKDHFGLQSLASLVTTTRVFPITARADLPQGLNETFDKDFKHDKLLGIHQMFSHGTLSMADLISGREPQIAIAPLQYDDVEVGADQPVRCLKQGVWLSKANRLPFAVLLSQEITYRGSSGLHVEIAVPPGEEGVVFSRGFNDALERKVNANGSYRGRVLSLEKADNYTGKASAVRVHRLRSVTRSQVILPDKTLRLLERNVGDFIHSRAALKKLGMPLKKGLLFYGPPGTGKTHTIHYLANQIPHHTTFLINAEQVGLLDHYFQLARFMQPALVVIEDADLIARARTTMNSPCEEKSAQPAAERNGRAARGCGAAFCPDDEPAGRTGTRPQRATRANRPSHRVPAAGCGGSLETYRSVCRAAGNCAGSQAEHRRADRRRQRRFHQGVDAPRRAICDSGRERFPAFGIRNCLGAGRDAFFWRQS